MEAECPLLQTLVLLAPPDGRLAPAAKKGPKDFRAAVQGKREGLIQIRHLSVQNDGGREVEEAAP